MKLSQTIEKMIGSLQAESCTLSRDPKDVRYPLNSLLQVQHRIEISAFTIAARYPGLWHDIFLRGETPSLRAMLPSCWTIIADLPYDYVN